MLKKDIELVVDKRGFSVDALYRHQKHFVTSWILLGTKVSEYYCLKNVTSL
jgi:hypothetical protein